MNPVSTIKNKTEVVPAMAPAARARRAWLIPAALLLVYVAQCAWFIRTQSFTFDEPVHIVTGWDMWRNGRFELWNDHPPLGRLLCTLPIVSSKWHMDVGGQFPAFR